MEAGLSREEARARFVVCTSVGALGKADGTHGDPNASRGLSEERATWVNDKVPDGHRSRRLTLPLPLPLPLPVPVPVPVPLPLPPSR